MEWIKSIMSRLATPALILLVLVLMGTSPVPPEEATVKWLTFAEAVEKSRTEKRQFFIDVYTDWCGWCKVMDKNTFSDPRVAKILNEKFYPVKFNAEQREDVNFNGQRFKFVESGRSGYHEFAAALLQNKLSYPTVVFVNADFTAVTPLPGYKKPEEFHKYLVFFAEEHFKKGQNSWKEFEKSYQSPYGK